MIAAEVCNDSATGPLTRPYVAKIVIADAVLKGFAEGESTCLLPTGFDQCNLPSSA